MGKTPERRVFTTGGALRYRRKVPDNQQPEPTDAKAPPPQPQTPEPKQQPKRQPKQQQRGRSSRSPPGRRFRPKPRQPRPQQPALLKQLLWKAKAVQPAPQPPSSSNDEDEEAAFAKEQRQARKLLASGAEALAASSSKATTAETSEPFVVESSSQETQSGSEDETVFLPYNGLPVVEAAKWQVFSQQQQQDAEETDGEEAASPVMPTETADAQTKEQDELEKAAANRRNQRQKYKLKQKQKRAAAKEHKRLQYQQKQVHEGESERPRSTEDDTSSTQEHESATVDIFHPPTNLASEMDAGVCRAVLSQLKDVVPFIVVGDVACPVVADEAAANAAASDRGEASAAGAEVAVVDFRQHVIAMLDRSKETQMQYRESFVVEDSGFNAASSYDFFKRRFCEVQRSAGIVYY